MDVETAGRKLVRELRDGIAKDGHARCATNIASPAARN
jgi:hypothetical protein